MVPHSQGRGCKAGDISGHSTTSQRGRTIEERHGTSVGLAVTGDGREPAVNVTV